LSAGLRVLIVEDNRDTADMLSDIVHDWGHETRVAYDGVAGLQVADQFQPQVVLLDIGLPKLPGYDVARRLRERDWGQEALVVAVTGWGEDSDRRKSEAAGIDHHLVKPVNTDVLEGLLSDFKPAE
jgi:DNA-binding response OmpR family regulator